MSSDSPLEQFRVLARHIGWTDRDEVRVRRAWPYVEPYLDQIVSDFYQAIQENPSTSRIITGGQGQIARLKQSLVNWLQQVFTAKVDIPYLESRQRLGKRHVDVGLEQHFAIAAMARLRAELMGHASAVATSDDELVASLTSLSRRLDLDLALIDEAYRSEHSARQLPVNQSRIRQQRAVVELGHRALEASELSPLFEFAVLLAADALAADQCLILEWLESTRQLVVHAAYGLAMTHDGPRVLSSDGEHLSARVLKERKLRVVLDSRQEPAAVEPSLTEDVGVVSLAGVPLWSEQRMWGVLVVHTRHVREFLPGDLDCLQAMANILSAGVGRKHTELKMIQAERLAGIGQMMTGIAHESRNALQRIQAATEMLQLDCASDPTCSALVRRIERAQNDLTRLFDEVRGYAAPLVLSRDRVDLRQLWRNAWWELVPFHVGRVLTLCDDQADDANLWANVDGFRLTQVFRNLFENSIAATRQDVIATVEVDAMQAPEGPLRILVRDNGPGLSDVHRQQAFDPFFTTRSKGTGLGLAIARRIIEAHGGTINFVTHPKPGACIQIILPRG